MSTINLTSKKKNSILVDLIKFYIPLGIYSMIMSSSHSVINAGVSRTSNPEIALAAYAVAMSIMNMFASPTFTSRQMLVAMARDKKSFHLSLSLMFKVGIASLAILGVVAFTPVGKFVFINIFNAPPEIYPDINLAARFCIILPFIYTLRAYSQGIIMVQKKTQYMTYSVIVRIILMVALATILPMISGINGAVIGILIWTAGMSCEAILNFILAIPLFKKLPEEIEPVSEYQAFSKKKAFNFLWPLIAMSFMWALGKPLINFGLTRTANPKLSLATFQVAQNFAWILMAFVENNLRQATLIFGTNNERINYLRRFTLTLSLILASILAVLAFTPLGNWSLLNIIGVTPELALASRSILIILIVAPILIAWTEFYMGLLMGLGNTKSLSIGKLINMTTATITIFALASIAPQLGATAGAIGTLSGIAIEMFFLRFAYIRLSKHEELKEIAEKLNS